MKLDLVHDLQHIYRKLLNSMSRPGSIENINSIGQKVNMQIDLDKNLTALLMSLLDGEVSYCFIAPADKNAESKINQLTYATKSCIAQADYIIITNRASEQQMQLALSEAKMGTLRNPHESATVIIQVEQLSNDKQLQLKGPGIKDKQDLYVQDDRQWLIYRNEKVQEFPLGIDIVMIDTKGNIACLPRTTRIVEQVVI